MCVYKFREITSIIKKQGVKMSEKREIQRHEEILLAFIERPVLQWLVNRLPAFMTPDWLTGFGLLGNFIILVAYILTNYNSWFLWLVNLGLIISWFGDSMDGTVARYRKTATRYGFYYDHIVDSFSGVLICVGWGLSPYISMDIALCILIAYLMMSIRSYMYAMVTGIFKIAYAGVGGTEIRVFAFIVNTIAFYVILPEFHIFNQIFNLYDLIGIVMTISLSVSFFIATIGEMNEIRRSEDSPAA